MKKYWNQKGNPLYDTYVSFMAMKSRVKDPKKNPKNKNYYDNIEIQESWLVRKKGFELFVKQMGIRPGKNYTIDRIDSNKGYYHWNCRWADKTQQVYNSKIRHDNTSGCSGVWWEKKLNKWRACLQYKGKRKSLGCFVKKEDAINVYKKAKEKVKQ